jgi:hypothetical protein
MLARTIDWLLLSRRGHVENPLGFRIKFENDDGVKRNPTESSNTQSDVIISIENEPESLST